MKRDVLILILGLIAAGLVWAAWSAYQASSGGAVPTFPIAGSYKDVTFTIDGAPMTIATKGVTYFGNDATGDLNGDGLLDTAYLVTYDGGGSGTFYYVVVALKTSAGYRGVNAIFIGDRIAPQTTEISGGELIVNYADRAPTDPMSTPPSVGVSKYLHIVDGVLVPLNHYSGSGFSLTYPDGWSVGSTESGGAKFTINPGIAAGTNLGSDTYLSVEQVPKGAACVDATSTDAGAGNRYEDWTYAIKGSSPCIAVHYVIHYSVIENYPEGAVKEFDRAGLLATFDTIRDSLVVR